MSTEDVSMTNAEEIISQTGKKLEDDDVNKKQKKTSKKKPPTLYVQTNYDKKANIVTQYLFAFYWAGEIPTTVLKIFGCYQAYAKTLRQMRKEAVYVNKVTKERITGIALKTATIKHRGGNDKILRLTETGKKLLGWLDLREDYEGNYPRNASDDAQKERACRFAEVVLMNYVAGFTYEFVDSLEFENDEDVYMCDLKKLSEIRKGAVGSADCINEYGVSNDDGQRKILSSRVCSLVVSRRNFYAVYNTRSSMMKWARGSELRVIENTKEMVKSNTGKSQLDSAILLAASYRIGMSFLEEHDTALCGYTKLRGSHLYDVYDHIHCIPFDKFGVGAYDLLVRPGKLEKAYRLYLNENEMRGKDHISLAYDGEKDGKYVLFFFDGDLARLFRVKAMSHKYNKKLVIYCFEEQEAFLRAYLSRDWESVKGEPEDKRCKMKKRYVTEHRQKEIESMYDKYKDGFYELNVINWNQFDALFYETYEKQT